MLPIFSLNRFGRRLSDVVGAGVGLALGSAAVVVGMLCAIVGVLSLIDDRVAAAREVESRVRVVDVDVAAARPFPRAFSVTSAAVTTLELSSTSTTTSSRCVVTTSATPLFLVAPTAANTTDGEGPYCADCTAGAVFTLPASRGYARTSAGVADVRCSFFDGAVVGSGGGGLSPGAAAAQFLRLDASNGPLTSALSVSRTAPTILAPTYTTPAAVDLAIAPAGGASRGIFLSSSGSTTFDNGVVITGTQAAAAGRTSVLVSTTVSGASSDRYPLRVTSQSGDVLRVAGNGNLALPLAGSSLVFADGSTTSSRPTGGAAVLADTVVGAGSPLDVSVTLTVGSYHLVAEWAVNIVGGSGGDGVLLSPQHSGGLVLTAHTLHGSQMINGVAPGVVQIPSGAASYLFWGSAASTVRLEAFVNVTTAGTYTLRLARSGAPTTITVLSGSGLSVSRL